MRRSASISAPCAAVLLVATGLGGCVQTSTYGTGEAPEMAIFRELTGGLAGKKQQTAIEYQPRAPLVMPPATGVAALPPPVETASVANAAWPIDPDQTPTPPKEPYDDNPADDMSPEYVARLKPLAGMGNPNWENSYGGDRLETDYAYDIIDDKNGRETFQAALQDAKGVGRTGRRYLTDPPVPYREPAATAPAEFEDIDEDGGGNWLTRLLTGG